MLNKITTADKIIIFCQSIIVQISFGMNALKTDLLSVKQI